MKHIGGKKSVRIKIYLNWPKWCLEKCFAIYIYLWRKYDSFQPKKEVFFLSSYWRYSKGLFVMFSVVKHQEGIEEKKVTFVTFLPMQWKIHLFFSFFFSNVGIFIQSMSCQKNCVVIRNMFLTNIVVVYDFASKIMFCKWSLMIAVSKSSKTLTITMFPCFKPTHVRGVLVVIRKYLFYANLPVVLHKSLLHASTCTFQTGVNSNSWCLWFHSWNRDNVHFLSLLVWMLQVANLANAKWCKKTEKWLKPWHMVLIWEYSARVFQLIPTWQGLVAFQKALDKRNLSIGRVKHVTFSSNFWGGQIHRDTDHELI